MASEIDFDELDRAVSSLIGKAPATTKPDTTVNETIPAQEPAASTSYSVAVNVKPSVAPAPDPAPEPETELETEPTFVPGRPVVPAAKRGGRFMDVVHKSSDMRTNDDDSVSPLTMTLSAPVSDKSQATPVPEPTMPDPIDFQTKKDKAGSVQATPSPALVSTDDPTDSEAAKVDALVKEIAASDEPQTSPFLPNAKVTKRPLGTFSVDAPELEANKPIPEIPDSSDDPVPPDTQSVLTAQTITPSDDLVNTVTKEQELHAAERAEADKEAAEAAAKAKPSAAEQKVELEAEAQRHLGSDLRTPLPEELQSDVLAIESNVANMQETATAGVNTSGPTSIVQQYKEKASQAKPSGAIYDTESYHKPLQHPAPKKSGWLLTLVIIGIIIVGGGVGAAVYFVGLPLLKQ